MEEKQLDFNQPLLSVRKFSSTVSASKVENKRNIDNAHRKLPPLPVYNSELKSGPVRNPGTVPFVWEKTPGKPKYESKPQTQAREQSPIAPKLPPGRCLNVKQQASHSEGMVDSRSKTKNVLFCSQNVLYKNATKDEKSKEEIRETGSSASVDDDEAYEDALDNLSMSESCFFNCSISGVSGLDGPDLNPSGTFFTDPHARDFMISRFLPAAKAVASETPLHSTRRRPVAREQPGQMKKIVNVQKRHSFNQYMPNNAPHYAQGDGIEESEDEDDDYDGAGNSSLKVCGLFPRLCLQNSLCLLNPVPGMRKQSQAPISSVRTRKVKSSYVPSCSRTENEHVKYAAYDQRSIDGNVNKDEPNQITCKADHWELNGSSLDNGLNAALLCHNKFSQPAVHEEKEFLGIPEKSKNYGVSGLNPHAKCGSKFRELLACESNEWESGLSPMVEKTLYIDSVYVVKTQISDSSSSDMKGITDCRKDGVELILKNRAIEETASVDSSVQDIKGLNAAGEEAKVLPESLDSIDSCFLSLSDRSIDDVQMDMIDGSRQDQDLSQVSIMATPKVDKDGKVDFESQVDRKSGNLESSHGLIDDSVSLISAEVADDATNNLKSQLHIKLSDQETSNSCYSLLLPPPLPKSPSESWLKQTLPTVSMRNSSSRSSLGMHAYARVQASKRHSPDIKWETIVKTSNKQHGHLRFSEELLTTIPEA